MLRKVTPKGVKIGLNIEENTTKNDMVASGGVPMASRDVLGPFWGSFRSLLEEILEVLERFGDNSEGFLVICIACFAEKSDPKGCQNRS